MNFKRALAAAESRVWTDTGCGVPGEEAAVAKGPGGHPWGCWGFAGCLGWRVQDRPDGAWPRGEEGDMITRETLSVSLR